MCLKLYKMPFKKDKKRLRYDVQSLAPISLMELCRSTSWGKAKGQK